jgi:hypothetical protein
MLVLRFSSVSLFRRSTCTQDKEKIRNVLGELSSTGRSFSSLVRTHLENLAATLAPSVRGLIELFQQSSYELTEQDFQALESTVLSPDSPSWLDRFCLQLDSMLLPMRQQLSAGNADQLQRLLVADIALRLEKAVLSKRYNALGGLQLERDLRRLVAYLSSTSQSSVRAEFARLTQLASLLSLEKASEVMSFWGEASSNVAWRLTPADIRRALSKRADFAPAEINALKL